MTSTTDVRSPLLGEVERMEAALQRVRAYIGSLSRVGPPRGVDIVTMVAFEWDMGPEELKTRSNTRHYAEPRHVAAFLLRELTKASLTQIGRDLGGFHYSTIFGGVRAIQRQMAADPILQERVESIRRRLR